MSRRQFLASSAAVASTLGLVACGGASNTTETTTAAGSAAGSAAAATAASFPKKYIIATDTTFAPFEFTNEANEFVGIDVDLLATIAKKTGFEYDLQSLGFDAAVAALESGQADGVIAGMSITDARKEKYDFSDPYYDSYVCCASKADSEFADLDSLKGTTVAVKTGTQSADWAESLKDEYQLTLTYFDESSLMYQDVLTGNSTACFEDYPIMAYGITQGNGLQVIGVDDTDFYSPYGFAVLKGQNPELLDAFNTGLADIKASGEYDAILATYLDE
jgi:ABC-type amino acid transport substrate-binding protein